MDLHFIVKDCDYQLCFEMSLIKDFHYQLCFKMSL